MVCRDAVVRTHVGGAQTVLEQTSPQVSDSHDQTLRNPDFAHATRGRTYDYLKSRKNMNPDQKYVPMCARPRDVAVNAPLARPPGPASCKRACA